jgi:LytS/YehU family sensor histidine kinase
MDPVIPLKKLFRLAAYTSPVIGILAIGTVSVVPYFFLKGFDFPHLFLFLAVGSVVIFTFWSINIALTHALSKPGRGTISRPIKYLLSYTFVSCFVLCVRFTALHFVDEHAFLNRVAPANTIYFINIMRVSIIFSINTIILILQDLVLIRETKTVVEIENAQLKIKNMEALNQQLKQQIHPHFLFNSLTTLKSLIKRNPEDAEAYLIKLSDFLRVSISLGQVDTLTLDEELKLCSNYLDMQKMRFGEALQHQVDVPEEIRRTGSVPVFSMQLLLENVIKHNALTNEAPLHIRIGYADGWVEVSNNLQKKQTTEASLGFGLINLTERYRLLGADEPHIEERGSNFSVKIKVLKDGNSHN